VLIVKEQNLWKAQFYPERVFIALKIEGRLDPRWASWFNSLTITVEGRDRS